jgi:hypothetical protein
MTIVKDISHRQSSYKLNMDSIHMKDIELELSDDEVEYLNEFKSKGIRNARELF